MRYNPLRSYTESYTEDENENGNHKTWLIHQDTLRWEFQDGQIYIKADGINCISILPWRLRRNGFIHRIVKHTYTLSIVMPRNVFQTMVFTSVRRSKERASLSYIALPTSFL